MASFEANRSLIANYSSSLPIVNHIQDLADKVRDAAAFRVPQSIREGRTGPHLGDTIQVTPDSRIPGSFLVGSTLPHARVHHEGAREHIIAPRRPALVFFWPKVGARTIVPKGGNTRTGFRGGVFVIGKGYVNHPGHAPNPYLVSALIETVQGG